MIKLRAFAPEDTEQYRLWVNDPDTRAMLGRTMPVSKAEHREWYKQLIVNKSTLVLAIDTFESDYVGNVWLWGIDWRHCKAEVRIVIGDMSARGKGIGTEALKQITKIAFEPFLCLYRLYAYVLVENIAARKAFERAGYSVEGLLRGDRIVDGVHHDVFLMSALRDTWEGV